MTAGQGLNTITTLRMPDGQEVAFVDWSDKTVWSTGEFAHGFVAQKTDIYGYSSGDAIPSAPPAGLAAVARNSNDGDSNLPEPGGMASTEERMVYAMKPAFYALTADEPVNNRFDFNTAQPRDATGEPNVNPVMLKWFGLRTILSLQISKKAFAKAHIDYFNTGFGPFAATGTMGAAAAAGRTYANHGSPGQDAVRSYVIPNYMGGQEKFRVTIENPGGIPVNFGFSENGAIAANTNAVMRVIVYLDGLWKRPTT